MWSKSASFLRSRDSLTFDVTGFASRRRIPPMAYCCTWRHFSSISTSQSSASPSSWLWICTLTSSGNHPLAGFQAYWIVRRGVYDCGFVADRRQWRIQTEETTLDASFMTMEVNLCRRLYIYVVKCTGQRIWWMWGTCTSPGVSGDKNCKVKDPLTLVLRQITSWQQICYHFNGWTGKPDL